MNELRAEYLAEIYASPELEAEPDPNLDLLRVVDAAEVLRVHPSSVYRWATTGELVSFRAGRVVRIRRVDLSAFVERNLSQTLPNEPLKINHPD